MVAFRKMHGLGNDFVVLDAREEPLLLPEARIRRIGDRRRGIGFDQLLVLDPPRSDGTAAYLRIYNPDGSEAGACGNGTRCIADILLSESGHGACVIETRRGLLNARRDGDLITVDMGAAQLAWADIPLTQDEDTLHLPITEGALRDPVAVGMGNPHCIFFVPDAEAVDLERHGPVLEHHPLFPERTNVELVSRQADGGFRVRVWERGAGITPACGSGTCAAAVAAHRRGLIDAESAPVALTLDGGVLSVQWRASGDGHVLMTGPVAHSFVGETLL